MSHAVIERIVAEYQTEAWKYERIARLVARFLAAEVKGYFLHSSWPVLHEVQHRAKSQRSLYKNLMAGRYDAVLGESEYMDSSALWSQVKDLAGVRLVFHFRSDLDEFLDQKARGQLERWFGQTSLEVDQMQVSLKDKRKRVKEVFGYSSYHFPVAVAPDTDFWRSLTYEDQLMFPRRFECEVQMRTVLQHAWAEAEHDLRYKGTRSSSREDRLWGIVSAILEGADYLISERKGEAVSEDASIASARGAGSEGWTYRGSLYLQLGAFSVGYSNYGYLLLHDWQQEPIQLESSDSLFNVDAEIERGTGLKEFKSRMWQQLIRDEPVFVRSLQFDGTAVRASGWDEASHTLRVQPALYSDQMVTNHKKALGQNIDGRLVEGLGYEAVDPNSGTASRSLLALEKSPFSNTIGVSCVLRTTDNRWVIVQRAGTLAYEPGRLGCSASGSLAWSEPLQWGSRTIESWLVEGLARECLEELGYRPSIDQIRYLAFCREIERAGKPQFFFFVDMSNSPTGVSAARLKSCWQMYADREHTSLHFLPVEQALALASCDAEAVQRVTTSLNLAGGVPSEELRANLALALKFDKKLDTPPGTTDGAV